MNEAPARDTGAMRLEINEEGTALHVQATRSACRRWSEILAEAAKTPSGGSQTGSATAEDLSNLLGASVLAESPVALGEFSLDEMLGQAEAAAAGRTWKDRLGAVGCALAGFAAMVVVVRGIVALANDIFGW